jgi:antitoxin CptB
MPGLSAFAESGRNVTARSSEGLDARRRKMLFRAWHRGLREADLILGRFADAHLAALDESELAQFDRLLEAPTRDIVSWVMGEFAPPPEDDTPLLRRLCEFYALKDRPE